MSDNYPAGNMFPDDPMSPLYDHEELDPEEELFFED